MIAASQALFGPSEFGVRALFWAAGAVLPALVYALGRRLYGDTQLAATAALFYVAAPLAAGAPLATPDTPLVLFWTLALLGLVEVWRGTPWAWAVVGAATGAAGLSKMTAGFLGLGVALALIAAPSLRREWARPGPYAAAALALFVLSPFLFWNATHGFATFLKQGGRLTPHGFSPRYLAEFLGSQLLLFNPLTAALALRGAVLRRGAPRGGDAAVAGGFGAAARLFPDPCAATTACKAIGPRRSIRRWRCWRRGPRGSLRRRVGIGGQVQADRQRPPLSSWERVGVRGGPQAAPSLCQKGRLWPRRSAWRRPWLSMRIWRRAGRRWVAATRRCGLEAGASLPPRSGRARPPTRSPCRRGARLCGDVAAQFLRGAVVNCGRIGRGRTLVVPASRTERGQAAGVGSVRLRQGFRRAFLKRDVPRSAAQARRRRRPGIV